MSLLDTLRFSVACIVLGVVALGGCSDASNGHDDHGAGDGHAGHDHSGDSDAARIDTYAGIVGEIKFLPEAGDTKMHPKIHHVQIPGFKKDDGSVAMSPDGIPGMRSMTMEFPLGEGVSLEGFEIDDKVRFDFVVSWGDRVAWKITHVERIDQDTAIDYSNKKSDDGP